MSTLNIFFVDWSLVLLLFRAGRQTVAGVDMQNRPTLLPLRKPSALENSERSPLPSRLAVFTTSASSTIRPHQAHYYQFPKGGTHNQDARDHCHRPQSDEESCTHHGRRSSRHQLRVSSAGATAVSQADCGFGRHTHNGISRRLGCPA